MAYIRQICTNMDLNRCNSIDELKQKILKLRNENRELRDRLENKDK